MGVSEEACDVQVDEVAGQLVGLHPDVDERGEAGDDQLFVVRYGHHLVLRVVRYVEVRNHDEDHRFMLQLDDVRSGDVCGLVREAAVQQRAVCSLRKTIVEAEDVVHFDLLVVQFER